MSAADEYERLRRRFVHTISECGPEQLTTFVPATPAWRVRDVLAHVVGLCADLNALRLPDRALDPSGNDWTERQVEARRKSTVTEILDEWDTEAPRFVEGLDLFGREFACHFIADLHAHHQDVRQALGAAPDDDPVTVSMALDHYLGFVAESLTSSGWGRITVRAGDRDRIVGDGPQSASVTAEPFELLRCLSARRSRAQVLALEWSGDVDGAVDAIAAGFTGNYAWRDTDLHDPSPDDGAAGTGCQ